MDLTQITDMTWLQYQGYQLLIKDLCQKLQDMEVNPNGSDFETFMYLSQQLYATKQQIAEMDRDDKNRRAC